MKKKTVVKKKVAIMSGPKKKEKQEVVNNISQFTYKEVDVNLIFRNGMIGYTFEKDGKTFGQKVKPESKSVHDVMSATFLIVQNFIETLEATQLIK